MLTEQQYICLTCQAEDKEELAMSGSGSIGGGGGAADATEDCANLFEQTTLNSPNPAVITQLKPGDILALHLQTPRGPVIAVTDGGDTAGSITSAILARLITCLDAGHQFIALVLAVQGGACDVEIRPR